MRHHKGSLVLSLLALLAACTRPPPHAAKPTGSASPSPRPLRVNELTKFNPGDNSILSLTLWNHYLAWGAADGEDSPSNRVVLYDIATHKKRVIARTTTSKAQIETVIGDSDTLVYTELARRPDTSLEKGLNVPWSEYLIDLKTGVKRKILSFRNDDPKGPFFPHPSFEWPWVIETLPGDNDSVAVMAYDMRSNKWKTLLSGVQIGFGFQIDRELVVFGARSPGGGPNSQSTDLFVVPVDGSRDPRRLTSSGEVVDITAANGAAAWHEPINGDPTSLWWLPLNQAAEPQKLLNVGGYSPYPGTGFVAWTPVEGGKLFIRAPSGTDPTLELPGDELYLPARWVAFEDRIAWATSAGPQAPIEIHVAKISPG